MCVELVRLPLLGTLTFYRQCALRPHIQHLKCTSIVLSEVYNGLLKRRLFSLLGVHGTLLLFSRCSSHIFGSLLAIK